MVGIISENRESQPLVNIIKPLRNTGCTGRDIYRLTCNNQFKIFGTRDKNVYGVSKVTVRVY